MSFKNTLQSLALKGLGLSQAAKLWLSGGDVLEKTPDRPNKPYAQVELVYACINKLIKSISALPLILSTTDEKIIESGPVYDLLFNSKPTFDDLIIQTVGHYVLGCDVFWVFTEMAGLKPTKIQVVSGSQMHPLTSDRTATGELVGWEYRSGNHRTQLTLLEVHQIKNFNPYDKFHGIGPTSAAALSISQAYQSALFNESSLANGAEPGPIIMLDGNVDPDKLRNFREQFDSRHAGAKKAKRTAVLSGVKEVKTLAMNMIDMQMAELRTLSDNRICSAFGVPPALVGLVTEAQYAHGPAQQDYVINTVIPLANLIAGEITSAIISKFSPTESRGVDAARAKSFYGRSKSALRMKSSFRNAHLKALQRQTTIFAWFDTDENPIVQAMRRETSEKVLKFVAAGVPLNNLIAAHDLPYEETEWGNDWWIGMGQVPARLTLEAGLEGLTGPSLPEGGAEDESKSIKPEATKANEAQRLRIWRNWSISWAGIEREFEVAMRKFFLRQERELLDKLKKAMASNKSINKADADEIIARVVFDLKKENGKIKIVNQSFFEKSSELGIRQIASEVGIAGESLNWFVETAKRNAAIRHALTVQAQKISGINKTTQKFISNQLKAGLESGEGLNDLTKRLKKVLGSNRARALSIARTQTAGAVGSGRHVGMKQAGVELKIWLTSGDGSVRDSHRDAGQRYAKGIPLDEAFVIGGDFLMHPCDPGGSPANVINCRCVELAARAKGKTIKIEQYLSMKFYSYSDLLAEQKENKDG